LDPWNIAQPSNPSSREIWSGSRSDIQVVSYSTRVSTIGSTVVSFLVDDSIPAARSLLTVVVLSCRTSELWREVR
jgi:hypothetical protein